MLGSHYPARACSIGFLDPLLTQKLTVAALPGSPSIPLCPFASRLRQPFKATVAVTWPPVCAAVASCFIECVSGVQSLHSRRQPCCLTNRLETVVAIVRFVLRVQLSTRFPEPDARCCTGSTRTCAPATSPTRKKICRLATTITTTSSVGCVGLLTRETCFSLGGSLRQIRRRRGATERCLWARVPDTYWWKPCCAPLGRGCSTVPVPGKRLAVGQAWMNILIPHLYD